MENFALRQPPLVFADFCCEIGRRLLPRKKHPAGCDLAGCLYLSRRTVPSYAWSPFCLESARTGRPFLFLYMKYGDWRIEQTALQWPAAIKNCGRVMSVMLVPTKTLWREWMG